MLCCIYFTQMFPSTNYWAAHWLQCGVGLTCRQLGCGRPGRPGWWVVGNRLQPEGWDTVLDRAPCGLVVCGALRHDAEEGRRHHSLSCSSSCGGHDHFALTSLSQCEGQWFDAVSFTLQMTTWQSIMVTHCCFGNSTCRGWGLEFLKHFENPTGCLWVSMLLTMSFLRLVFLLHCLSYWKWQRDKASRLMPLYLASSMSASWALAFLKCFKNPKRAVCMFPHSQPWWFWGCNFALLLLALLTPMMQSCSGVARLCLGVPCAMVVGIWIHKMVTDPTGCLQKLCLANHCPVHLTATG